jgi:hypothetical protein
MSHGLCSNAYIICLAAILMLATAKDSDNPKNMKVVAYKNYKPRVANAPFDIHDGPIIQTGDSEFYRFAMGNNL